MMSVLEEFLKRDMEIAEWQRGRKSYLRQTAERIVEDVRRALRHPRVGTSMARAVLHKCPPKPPSIDGIPLESGFELAAGDIIPTLYESIASRREKLEKDPSWQAVMLAPTEDDRTDALEDFFRLCAGIFRNDCMEAWRNRYGTYANVYRKTQRALRRHAKGSGWSLYAPKARYYGPEGMDDPLPIDELNGAKLKGIPLPKGAPYMGRVFRREPFLELAAWFYEEINRISPQGTDRACVAIRNLARWLCFSYPLLVSEESWVERQIERMGMPFGSDSMLLTDVDALARKAAASLSPLERKIMTLKMDQRDDREIASILELSEPTEVGRRMRRIRRIIRDARLGMPEMCGAWDMDGIHDAEDVSAMEKRFSDAFMECCLKDTDHG